MITGQPCQYSSIGSFIDISKFPVSARWLDIAKDWIRRCVIDHPNCRNLAAPVMPKRVLNVYGAPYLHGSEGVEASTSALATAGADRRICLLHAETSSQ
jgi:hypothetical protein